MRMYIIKNIKSEWQKMKHLFIKPCVVLIPILYALMMLIYESSLNCDIQKTYKFFSGGICLIFPIILSVYLSVMDLIEDKACHFQNILSNKTSKICYFFSKVILLLLLTLFIILLAFTTLSIGNMLVYNIYLPLNLFIKGSILFTISSIPMIVIYLVLTYMFGINMAILLGATGLLIVCVIGTTSLGDMIWCFFPSSYSLRVCFHLINSAAYKTNQIYICVIIAAVVLAISCYWFINWEGRKNI